MNKDMKKWFFPVILGIFGLILLLALLISDTTSQYKWGKYEVRVQNTDIQKLSGVHIRKGANIWLNAKDIWEDKDLKMMVVIMNDGPIYFIDTYGKNEVNISVPWLNYYLQKEGREIKEIMDICQNHITDNQFTDQELMFLSNLKSHYEFNGVFSIWVWVLDEIIVYEE